MQQSNKQTMPTAKHVPMRRMIATATTTMTPREHSRSSLYSYSSISSYEDPNAVSVVPVQVQLPVARKDEPNLFEIPSTLYPFYRPLPTLAKIATTIFSVALSAASTWPDRTINWLHPLLAVRSDRIGTFKKCLEFAVKCLVTGLVTNMATQEIFLSPSRISTTRLVEQYYLPSTLSRYEPLPVLPNGESLPVHWLEYHQKSSWNTSSTSPYAALYVNHGFGASSLSWLPALPSLVDQLGARIGIGHDAPGFGFTDRSNNLSDLTPLASSHIATCLLESKLAQQQKQQQGDDAATNVILMGHSMGSITTLYMALSLPPEMKKQIVLVAPALGISPQSNRAIQVQFPKWSHPALRIVGNLIVDPPATFFLKRLVGAKNFWRNGLQVVWGNPKRLSDSDVLRFQWPSIGQGWEKGLLAFTRAQFSIKADLTDRQLLEKVAAMPNTRVIVVLGGADKVMPSAAVRRFFASHPNIDLIELKGQGHDPFEEDVDMFVQTVKQALQS